MTRTIPFRTLPLLLISLLVGCGPSTAELVAERKAALDKTKAAVAAIAQQVKANTRLEGSGFEVKGPPPSFYPGNGPSAANAIAMAPEQFEGLGEDRPDFHVVCHNPYGDTLALMARGTLASGKEPEDSGKTADLLDTVAHLRYVLVVRLGRYVPPIARGATFISGSISGEAQLYDLSTRNLVGGLRFTARNSDTVNVQANLSEEFLGGNVRNNAITAIREAFTKQFPDSTPPLHGEW